MIDEFVRLSESDLENNNESLKILTQLLTELTLRGKIRKTLQIYKEHLQQKIKSLIKNVRTHKENNIVPQ
jgi:hypothetical protein